MKSFQKTLFIIIVFFSSVSLTLAQSDTIRIELFTQTYLNQAVNQIHSSLNAMNIDMSKEEIKRKILVSPKLENKEKEGNTDPKSDNIKEESKIVVVDDAMVQNYVSVYYKTRYEVVYCYGGKPFAWRNENELVYLKNKEALISSVSEDIRLSHRLLQLVGTVIDITSISYRIEKDDNEKKKILEKIFGMLEFKI